jgi:hypothetical protein
MGGQRVQQVQGRLPVSGKSRKGFLLEENNIVDDFFDYNGYLLSCKKRL